MPEQTYSAADRRARAGEPDSLPFHRREPGVATLLLGLAVMLLALILPQELRTFAFYPGLVCIAIGLFLTLRHGPERPKNG
ncbi:MAG TPA: hypothetical protein VIC03_00085 [Gemmatimonadaceae bacterium]|jgi:hypothetical protein